MPELLLELFSEEIPARMQVRAAEDLARLVSEALAPLAPREMRRFSGPRRIAIAAEVAAGVAESRQSERGPRLGAPEQALAGFLRKHGASRDDLREEGAFWMLDRAVPGQDAATLIAGALPALLRRFPWPKSMRWGGSSAFTWVRPLRRILCILDGTVVPFDLRRGEDDGHGLASDNLTEGHRFMAPGAFAVASVAQWQETLQEHRVIANAAVRLNEVADGIAAVAARRGFTVVQDDSLMSEVSGLVEWPVPLLGRIDAAFMDLPPEVMQVSMRVNQRYFALRDAEGAAAPWFAFAANVEADDGGAAIVAGNERVLRARFSDARYFWDLDRRQTLAARVGALDEVTFHARLGSQGDRVRRIVALATVLWPGIAGSTPHLVEQGAFLCKADLTTGMVGEFPELQGIVGFYYASLDEGLEPGVAEVIRDHYAPRAIGDAVPTQPDSIVVALADRLDQIAGFFSIGERPTGSGDPFALRRAALGVVRILLENGRRLMLHPYIKAAAAQFDPSPDPLEILAFIFGRLKFKLRSENARYDILDAALRPGDDDPVLVLHLVDTLTAFIASDDGENLLIGYKRATSILSIAEVQDGPYQGDYDSNLISTSYEHHLRFAIQDAGPTIGHLMVTEQYRRAMEHLATLRRPIDLFFDSVVVNDTDPETRRNRLRLLAAFRAVCGQVADFSKIVG